MSLLKRKNDNNIDNIDGIADKKQKINAIGNSGLILLEKHQLDATQAIKKAFLETDKCLVKMFCGTGKTRIVFCEILARNFSVVVFPSIALVTQFNTDYIMNKEWVTLLQNKNIMSVCSKDELSNSKVNYTTKVEFSNHYSLQF